MQPPACAGGIGAIGKAVAIIVDAVSADLRQNHAARLRRADRVGAVGQAVAVVVDEVGADFAADDGARGVGSAGGVEAVHKAVAVVVDPVGAELDALAAIGRAVAIGVDAIITGGANVILIADGITVRIGAGRLAGARRRNAGGTVNAIHRGGRADKAVAAAAGCVAVGKAGGGGADGGAEWRNRAAIRRGRAGRAGRAACYRAVGVAAVAIGRVAVVAGLAELADTVAARAIHGPRPVR